MTVDCHTHIWEEPAQIGLNEADFESGRLRGCPHLSGGERWPDASQARHLRAAEPVDRTLVLSFKSRYLGIEIPAEAVARYVRRNPEKLIGVAGVDPTNLTEAVADLKAAHGELGMKAISVSPAAQDFHPADSRAMQVFAEAAQLGMPVLIDQGHIRVASKMEFARPVLLDEVARELPGLKLVISHLGFPWHDECIMLLGKHPNLYADVSGLLHQPWRAYHALLSAFQYGVIDKLLFASDFPFATATATIESLYRINQLVTGTNLPTVPRAHLAAIVERDVLAVLGIEAPGGARPAPARDDSELIESYER